MAVEGAEDGACQNLPAEVVAAQVIADCGGDARAAVIELVTLIGALRRENETLAAASSPGFARRAPGRR